MSKALCRVCGVRWAQERGLCRACRRAAGDTRGNKDFEALHVARRQQKIAARRPAPTAPPARKFRTIGQQTFEITWDGT